MPFVWCLFCSVLGRELRHLLIRELGIIMRSEEMRRLMDAFDTNEVIRHKTRHSSTAVHGRVCSLHDYISFFFLDSRPTTGVPVGCCSRSRPLDAAINVTLFSFQPDVLGAASMTCRSLSPFRVGSAAPAAPSPFMCLDKHTHNVPAHARENSLCACIERVVRYVLYL